MKNVEKEVANYCTKLIEIMKYSNINKA